ncbi:putative glyscosytransferase [Synechococcus sp. Minos11]|uniref:glycosyltransferase family 2 protein n=1 Tax=Synechococcus sp. Minos11 TaxID=221341 RepID=UPI001862216C|nr:glycosyltransferase family 2 protein [Synechococcus sp. Minos11]QNJ07657.1 putative glyscosytransferase [Synechococcus sp. Minos11]
MGTASPLVVVSVAYHSQSSLASLAADLGRHQGGLARWIVVDQAPGSAPLDPGPLRRHLGSLPLLVLQGEQGGGFGAGCNRALDYLQQTGYTGWVWLLNPDTSLPQGDEAQQLLEALVDLTDQAVVGTAVQDATGTIEPSAGWLDQGLNFRRRKVSSADSLRREPVRLDWLSGCSLLLQPAAHQPPARFDSRFPLYYEDMDLCLRLAQQGAPVLWLPQVVVSHQKGEGSVTPSSRRIELSTISYLRFLRRHCPPWVRQLRQLRLLLSALLRPRRAGAIWRGFKRAG